MAEVTERDAALAIELYPIYADDRLKLCLTQAQAIATYREQVCAEAVAAERAAWHDGLFKLTREEKWTPRTPDELPQFVAEIEAARAKAEAKAGNLMVAGAQERARLRKIREALSEAFRGDEMPWSTRRVHCWHGLTGPIFQVLKDGETVQRCCKCDKHRTIHKDHAHER